MHSSPERRRDGPRLHYFAAISGTGWLIDFFIFSVITARGHPYYAANLISAGIAVSFVYIVAVRNVFREQQNNPMIAAVLYTAWNVVAIMLASMAVQNLGMLLLLPAPARLLDGLLFSMQSPVPLDLLSGILAKLLVTPVTMYANFVVMGLIIERRFRGI